jgi:hypothetical protein
MKNPLFYLHLPTGNAEDDRWYASYHSKRGGSWLDEANKESDDSVAIRQFHTPEKGGDMPNKGRDEYLGFRLFRTKEKS